MGVMDRIRKTTQAAPAAEPSAAPAAKMPIEGEPPPPVVRLEAAKMGNEYLGERFLLESGQIAEFTGTSRDTAFFQTESGGVKLGPGVYVTQMLKAPPPAEATSSTEVAAVLPPDAAPRTTPPPAPAEATATPLQYGHLPQEMATAPVAAEPEKPKRGRPKKAEQPAAEAIAKTEENASKPAEPKADGVIAKPATVTGVDADEAGSLQVYVDAVPNCPAEPLAGYVATLVAAIEKTFSVQDVRSAPKKTADGKDHPLAFGAWKGLLANMVRTQPPAPGVYVALGTAGSEIMQVAVEALESLCAPGCFVRGVR